MSDRAGNHARISRRDYLTGAGAMLLAAAQPALATEQRTGPPGHRRTAPRFRPISLDK